MSESLRAQTPSQTIGPFFGYALPWDKDSELVPPHSPDSIRIHGDVRDGAGAFVPDAILELWQADASGRAVSEQGSLHRDGYTFTGFGRAAVNGSGHFSFSTVRPGAMAPGRAPYALLTVFARGITHHLFTKIFFEGEPANADDAFLASVPAERRGTLIARADGPDSYRFDVVLQGDGETVFIDFDGGRDD